MSPSAPIGQSWKPPLSSASRPGVCADQRPVVLSAVTPRKHLVHDHPHIRDRDGGIKSDSFSWLTLQACFPAARFANSVARRCREHGHCKKAGGYDAADKKQERKAARQRF